MAKKWFLVIVMIMLTVMGMTSGQDLTETNTIYVAQRIEDDLEAVDPTLIHLLTSFEAKLASHEIEVIWLEFETDENDIPVDILIDIAENSFWFYIIGDRLSSVEEELSPFLFNMPRQNQPTMTFSIPIDDTKLDGYVHMTTGFASYSINRCDIATAYLRDGLGLLQDTLPIASEEDLWAWRAYFYLGNCALLVHDFDAAINYFSPLEDWNLEGAVNLAWTYFQNGEQEKSITIMTNLIDPSMGEITLFALSHRAQLYALAFDYDSAITDMNTAIELSPDDPHLYVLRGDIIMLIYEWNRAMDNYNKAIELDPTYSDAYFSRGVLFYTRTDRENALADFQNYLKLAPHGHHTEQALHFIESIKIELDALGNN